MKEESVAQFVTRRAGKQAADIFADALVTGIHGGDPTLLSVAATFPRLPKMEHEAGSIIRGFLRAAKQRKSDAQARGEPPPGPQKMWSFRAGLQVLTDTLAESLGPGLKCGVTAQKVSRERAALVRPFHQGRVVVRRRGRAGLPGLRTGAAPRGPRRETRERDRRYRIQPHRSRRSGIPAVRLPSASPTASATSRRRTRAATCSACSGVRRFSRTAHRRGACCGGRYAAVLTAAKWWTGTTTR